MADNLQTDFEDDIDSIVEKDVGINRMLEQARAREHYRPSTLQGHYSNSNIDITDPYYIPEHMIPEGYSLMWARETAGEEADTKRVNYLIDLGYVPCLATEFPHLSSRLVLERTNGQTYARMGSSLLLKIPSKRLMELMGNVQQRTDVLEANVSETTSDGWNPVQGRAQRAYNRKVGILDDESFR